MKIRFLFIITLAGALSLVTACSGGGKKKPPLKNPGTISLTSSTLSVAEDAGTLKITVSRAGGTSGEATVDYDTQLNTATADDLTPKSGSLTWADGDGADKSIVIDITDDTELEFSESFSVQLSNADGAALGTTIAVEVTLNDDDSIVVKGQVEAPGGTIAAGSEASVDQWLQPVAGGVSVKIFALDNFGDINGAALTTAVTDSGGFFEILAPADALSSQYVAVAGDPDTMESYLVSADSLRINPVSDAVRDLVVFNVNNQEVDYSEITIKEINVIQDQLYGIRANFNLSGNDGSAASISGGLSELAMGNRAFENIVIHSLHSREVCGRVYKIVNDDQVGLANIDIQVHDFVDRTMKNRTVTDADGNYCVNVISGFDYIFGAINRTGDADDPHHTASEWWTSSDGTYFQFEAEMIRVTNTTMTRGDDTTITSVDFQLEPGKRISGTVTTKDGGSAEGVQIHVRDYDSYFPVARVRVGPDQRYSVNVAATSNKYMLVARNTTYYRPYATKIHNDTGGTNLRGLAAPVISSVADVDAASTQNYDFSLDFGTRVHGQVSFASAAAGFAVPGARVMVEAAFGGTPELNGAAARLLTDQNGLYQIWMANGGYRIYARGLNASVRALTASETAPYSEALADISGDFTSYSGKVVTDNGEPVGQAKIMVRDGAANLLGMEISGGDGSFQVFHETNLDAFITAHARIDGSKDFGSIVLDKKLSLTGANSITLLNTLVEWVLPTTGSGISGTADPAIDDMYSLRGINAPPNEVVTVVYNNKNNAGIGEDFFKTRVRGDGTFTLNLPTGTFADTSVVDYDVVFQNSCFIFSIDPSTVVDGIVDYNDCQTPQ